MKRLGVLGTAVLDSIRHPRRPAAVEALGGITYSLAAFEARPIAGWTLVPVMKVGRDAGEAVDAFLARLSRVGSLEGVRRVDEPNNRVELVYAEGGGRTERLTGGVPGWSLEELRPLAAGCDALYVNLIAGWEVELSTAERLGEVVPGPLYCDLHSLFLDAADGGLRRPRVPEGWREWVRCFDHVQVNREELELLATRAGADPWRLARELVGERPRTLFVTLGADGAVWLASGGGGSNGPRHGRVPLPDPELRADTTGCGDVWGMSCFAGLLEGRDPPAAVERANALARRNAGLTGAEAMLAAAREG